MTKTLIQSIVIIVSMAGFWVSLSTKLDTNSNASSEIASKLKDQIEAYRESQALLLTHVDATQSYVVTEIAQNSTLAQQNQKLLDSIDQLASRVLTLTEQNTDMLKQIKGVNDMQTQILNQHTQVLQDARTAARRTAVAAEGAQIDSRRTLRAVAKPTPRRFMGLFPLPSPTPRKR